MLFLSSLSPPVAFPLSMSRRRELKGRDSAVVSDEDDQMVPTERAEPQPEALPVQGGPLAPLGSAASSVAAPSGSHPSVSPVLAHAPQSESDMLGAICSLVGVTHRGRAETRNLATHVGIVLKRVEEQARQMDSMASLLQDNELRTRAIEELVPIVETKLAELTRTVAQHRSPFASPRLSQPASGSDASHSSVDPLLAVISWPSRIERPAADASVRCVLGLDKSHVLIFPRKYAIVALFKANTPVELKIAIDVSREGRLKFELWARLKPQQHGGFSLRKSVEFLKSCGCERVEKDSRVVYFCGLAIKVRDGELLKGRGCSWPEGLAGSLGSLHATAESCG